MKKTIKALKSLLKAGIIYGLLFASGMSLFDYFDKGSSSMPKFLFLVLFFGGFTAYANRFIYKKEKFNQHSKIVNRNSITC